MIQYFVMISNLSLKVFLVWLLSWLIYYVDVNECLTNRGGCDVNAKCADTIGSRTCTCNAGYQGSGVKCSGK